MKTILTILLTGLLFGSIQTLAAAGSGLGEEFGMASNYEISANGVSLSLNVSANQLQLGEILTVETVLKNNSSDPVFLYPAAMWCEGGNPIASIMIAVQDDKDYRQYIPEMRCISVDGVLVPDEIGSGKFRRRSETVLWNYNISSELKRLSKEAANSYGERILSDYAFQKPGVYFVKATTIVVRNDRKIAVESDPVKVTVTEPKGDDLKVWDQVKNNGEFAHFLQLGTLTRSYKSPETQAELIREFESILTLYPNTIYSKPLQDGLTKYYADRSKREEEKRRELLPKN